MFSCMFCFATFGKYTSSEHLHQKSKQNFVDCFSEKGFRGANICQMPILQSKYNSCTKINLSPCLMSAAFDPGAIFPQSNHNHELNFDCSWKTPFPRKTNFLRDKNVYQVLNCVEFKCTVNLASFFEDNGVFISCYSCVITRLLLALNTFHSSGGISSTDSLENLELRGLKLSGNSEFFCKQRKRNLRGKMST